jgi:hypothetical protein
VNLTVRSKTNGRGRARGRASTDKWARECQRQRGGSALTEWAQRQGEADGCRGPSRSIKMDGGGPKGSKGGPMGPRGPSRSIKIGRGKIRPGMMSGYERY